MKKRLAAALGALATAVLAFAFAPPAYAAGCEFIFCANGCYVSACSDGCEPDCYDDPYCTVVATGCSYDE